MFIAKDGGEAVTELEEAQEWGDDLMKMAERIRQHFVRVKGFQRAVKYMKGLLSFVERKNGWQMAEATGDKNPDGVQYLLARSEWDVEGVRDDLQAYVTEHLGEEGGVFAIDETGFLKKGDKSVGVQRQYSGTAGRIENCQIGVFLGYATSKGHTLVDRELYLPEGWAKNKARRKEAGVPKEVKFKTKPELARVMLGRAFDNGIPAKWVTGDEVYGNNGALRLWLQEQEKAYVLAVASNTTVSIGLEQHKASGLSETLQNEDWHRLSCGNGSKGPRLYDWANVALNTPHDQWQRSLLIRRSIGKPDELAYYLVFSPKNTPLDEIVRVAGTRWTIEECFEGAKGQVGLDQYEVRKWQSWYRHITLCLFAFAFLSVIQSQQALEDKAKKGALFKPRENKMKPFKNRRILLSR